MRNGRSVCVAKQFVPLLRCVEVVIEEQRINFARVRPNQNSSLAKAKLCTIRYYRDISRRRFSCQDEIVWSRDSSKISLVISSLADTMHPFKIEVSRTDIWCPDEWVPCTFVSCG